MELLKDGAIAIAHLSGVLRQATECEKNNPGSIAVLQGMIMDDIDSYEEPGRILEDNDRLGACAVLDAVEFLSTAAGEASFRSGNFETYFWMGSEWVNEDDMENPR